MIWYKTQKNSVAQLTVISHACEVSREKVREHCGKNFDILAILNIHTHMYVSRSKFD